MTNNPTSPSLDLSTIAIDFYDPLRDSLDEITDLLHRAYANLAEMGFNYVAATQSSIVTIERFAAGIPYIARLNNCIIGTITYYSTAPDDISEPDYYKRSDVAHFGQFAVSPEMQKQGIGHRLVELIEAKALQEGKCEIACDTAEGATHLIDFYKRRGYRPIGHQQWAHACYRSTILSKSLGTN
jgi:GNAT superfamily N-acetyltransferase